MKTMGIRSHWENIYRTRGPEERSWTQRRPAKSLTLIRAARLAPGASLLDAGAGASTLVDHLLKAGGKRLTLPEGPALSAAELDADCDDPKRSTRRSTSETIGEAVQRLVRGLVGP